MYNMQSGVRRKTFDVGPYPLPTPAAAGSSKKRDGRSITGLASDTLNTVVIASTQDGTLNVSKPFTFQIDQVNQSHPVLRFPYRRARANARFAVCRRFSFSPQ